MTRISIVGGGPAATIHAEAVRATAGAELVGVGGRPGTAADLATALAVDDLPLDELCASADALIVAVPPAEAPAVLAAAEGRVDAILVESPVATTIAVATALGNDTPLMTALNLLHAPTVRRGLDAIAAMSTPHHLLLRARAPRPSWGAHGSDAFGGVMLDPGARLLPVLLSAAAVPAVAVSASVDHRDGIDHRARLTLHLADGRTAAAELEWSAGETRARLEVADASGVVALELLPLPSLEIDNTPVADTVDDPLVALGFVDQVRRLAAVARGDMAPWADRSVGVGALTLATAAAMSAAAGAATVPCTDADPHSSPSAVLSRGQSHTA